MAAKVDAATKKALETLKAWAESEEYKEPKTVEVQRYAVCAGLAVCEHAKTSFPLHKADYLTDKNQVKTGGPFIQNILARFGIEKTYASEGGRTTRGTVPAARALVERLNEHQEIGKLPPEDREALFNTLQEWLVERVKDFFGRQRLEVDFDFSDSATNFIAKILATAKERNQSGAIAQHLVGAKLALRFPEMAIENHNYTTADRQLGRKGDFEIQDTIFHVTVAPAEALMNKIKSNLAENYRVVLITSSDKRDASSQLAEVAGVFSRIAIYPLETFVAQNIDELASFSRASFLTTFAALLRKYNERVDAIEADKSLLISIPGQFEG